MTARYLVHDAQGRLPQTHAIVIGVGDYPHLIGGSGKLSVDNDGMGQLTSPPASASRLADWLIQSFHNPSKPLGSVALLISEKTPRTFVNEKTGIVHQPENAGADEIAQAVLEWKARGDADPENLLIFYFCGHGISAGTEAALLASDYGADPDNSLNGAIDLRKLILGMDQCQAVEQSFFIDACRSSSDTLITAQSTGRLIVQPRIRNPAWQPRKTSTFYATLKGEAAYGIPDQPTVFTSSLLDSFEKYAADNEEGDWRINTHKMAESLDHLMARQRSLHPGIAQVPESNDRSKFHLHYLASAPKALVYLTCDPPDHLEVADLSYTPMGGSKINIPKPTRGATETELLIEAGMYNFSAVLPDRTVNLPWHISPVYRKIVFK